MKKLIALILVFVMAFGIAVPALAADEPIDTQTEITQIDTAEPTDPTDTEQPENPEEPETPEEPEQPENPGEPDYPEYPIEDEEAGYFDYLFGHVVIGAGFVGEAVMVMPFILIVPIAMLVPVFGWVVSGAALASPLFLLFGIGEVALSPVLALYDVITK